MFLFSSTEEATKLISEEKPKKVEVVSNIFPNINSVREEHNAHLDLINKKRDVCFCFYFNFNFNLIL